MKYEILRADRAANKDVKIGDVVFDGRGYDYGLSSDDTRMTGIEHVSVTLNEDGDYPTFTIPLVDLKEVASWQAGK